MISSRLVRSAQSESRWPLKKALSRVILRLGARHRCGRIISPLNGWPDRRLCGPVLVAESPIAEGNARIVLWSFLMTLLLAYLVTHDDIEQGSLYPALPRIREYQLILR
jgi:hypothetical protein